MNSFDITIDDLADTLRNLGYEDEFNNLETQGMSQNETHNLSCKYANLFFKRKPNNRYVGLKIVTSPGVPNSWDIGHKDEHKAWLDVAHMVADIYDISLKIYAFAKNLWTLNDVEEAIPRINSAYALYNIFLESGAKPEQILKMYGCSS